MVFSFYYRTFEAKNVGKLIQDFTSFSKSIPEKVTIVAVSKTKPLSDITQIYDTGHRIFGENKVQEMTGKAEAGPKDIEWHMIGHLQTNKVRFIVPIVSLIQSVDSLKLLTIINKEAKKANRVVDCLLQVHISSEDTKFGFSEEEIRSLLEKPGSEEFENVRLVGLMGMASFTDNWQIVRQEFRSLKSFFDSLHTDYFGNFDYFSQLSMGMSNDYKIAIEEGSTMIRIGSLIFGERNY